MNDFFSYSFLWRFLGPWVPRETTQPLQEREAEPSGAHDQPHEIYTYIIKSTYIYICIYYSYIYITIIYTYIYTMSPNDLEQERFSWSTYIYRVRFLKPGFQDSRYQQVSLMLKGNITYNKTLSINYCNCITPTKW